MSWLTDNLARVSVPLLVAVMMACGGERAPATSGDASRGNTGDSAATDSTNQDDTKANLRAFLGEAGGQASDSAPE
jgi:hypothetical protein